MHTTNNVKRRYFIISCSFGGVEVDGDPQGLEAAVAGTRFKHAPSIRKYQLEGYKPAAEVAYIVVELTLDVGGLKHSLQKDC